ncbi:MAG: hypothetical protein IPM74_19755 [Crocinitomicaceae bacterium]|nr:hypothetical protein [Crocinitomicaceae bacterium]
MKKRPSCFWMLSYYWFLFNDPFQETQRNRSRIISFEPNPHTYAIFEKNIMANGSNNVKLNAIGLLDGVL